LEKDKKNKDKVKQLQKDLQDKSKKIDQVLIKLVADTRKEFLTHAAKVDALLGESVKDVKSLEGAVKKFKTAPSNDVFLASTKVPQKLADRTTDARADSNEFGTSWFEMRGINWTSQGLDEATNKNFYKARFELMGDAKSVVEKISKLESLEKAAQLLLNEMRAAYGDGSEPDAGVVEEDAKDLLEKITTIHTDSNDKTYNIATAAARVRGVLDKPEQVTDALLGNLRSRMQDTIASSKDITTNIKLLTKEIAQFKKTVPNLAGTAKKSIDDCERLVGELQGMVTKANDGAKLYAEIYKDTNKILDARKKKK
jgi:methyl-accepting chemotaxis protein